MITDVISDTLNLDADQPGKDTAAAAPPLSAVPWPSMRGNARNTAAYRFNYRGQGLPVRHVNTKTDGPSLINATPIIGPNETIHVGSSNQHFYSWSQNTLNNAALPNIVDSAGCFADGSLLYFPCGNASLYSLNTNSPANVTQYCLGQYVQSPSTIDWFEGNVVTDGKGQLFAGCDNFFMYCCDAATGKFKWAFPTGSFIWSACAFSNGGGTAHFVSSDMTCYALNTQTGALSWYWPINNLCASSPAVTADGRVMFGAFDGHIYCHDAATGTPTSGTVDTGSLIYASPAISDADSRMYMMSSDGVLRAFDIGNRTKPPRELWSFFTGMASFSSPAIGVDPDVPNSYLIYAGSGNGKIYALTPDGRRRWSFDIKSFYPPAKGEPNDPAFWRSFRYPAINSSIALGNQGVVTATSGGLILSIPYDAYRGAQAAQFDRSPHDDYIDQIADRTTRLCFISPAGRMAGSLLPNVLGPSTMPVYPGQVISLAALGAKTIAPGQRRTTFTQLPQDLFVVVDGHQLPQDQWTVSADGTQLHIRPPAINKGSYALSVHAGSYILGAINCLQQRLTAPTPPDQVLTREYQVQQMSIYTPFIVPVLDQLGIATINIKLKFLSIQNGKAVAYACESFDASGTTVAERNLMYLFTGTYQDGVFNLKSGSCYFELTAAPILLDELTLSGTIGTNDTGGLSLTASYQHTVGKDLKWLLAYILHWYDSSSANMRNILQRYRRAATTNLEELKVMSTLPGHTLTVDERVLVFLLRLFAEGATNGVPAVMKPWKLFNEKAQFFWAGTFDLAPATPFGYAPKAVPNVSPYNVATRTLKVQVALSEGVHENGLVAGVLLFRDTGDDKDLSQPIQLNYSDVTYAEVRPRAKTIPITVELSPDDVRRIGPGSALKAVAMVGTEPATGVWRFRV